MNMALRRRPDFSQFLKVLKRQGRPDHLPFYGATRARRSGEGDYIMKGPFLRTILAAVALSALPVFAQEKGIQHRLLLEDESRSRMHFVDTADPSKHWEIVFPARYRDYQLIGQNRLLMNNLSGYSEYEMFLPIGRPAGPALRPAGPAGLSAKTPTRLS